MHHGRVDVFAAGLAAIRELCARLPQTHEEHAWVGIRWKVRGNTFAHLLEVLDGRPETFARAAGTAGPATVLTFRSEEPELAALLAGGERFFGPLWGRDDVGVLLDERTDWDEIAELVTDSYRLRAPRRLAAQLPD
jgi:hypothetical protein